MDTAAETQEELRLQLQDAVRREQYARAAGIKKELQELEAGDTVAAVVQDMEAALQQERYADAAKLRDEGMAGLQGWWCGSSEGDPVGHLLHVGPEYGRWTGRAYTARDLADLSGWREGAGPLQRLRSASAGGSRNAPGFSSSFGSRAAGTVGSPALEVFLRRGLNGELTGKQAVSLISGPGTGAAGGREQQRGASSSGRSSLVGGMSPQRSAREQRALDEMPALLARVPGVGPLAKLTISIERDGSTRIRAAPITKPGAGPAAGSPAADAGADATEAAGGASPSTSSPSVASGLASAGPRAPTAATLQTTMSTFSSWEAEEAAATLRELAELSGGSSGLGGDAAPEDGARPTDAGAAAASQGVAAVVEADEVVQGPQLPEEQLRVVDSMSPGVEAEVSEAGSSSSSGRAQSGRQSDQGRAEDLLLDVSAGAGAIEIDATVGEEAEDGEVSVTRVRRGGGGATSSLDGEEGESLFTELHRVPAEVEMNGRDAFVFRVPRDAAPSARAGARGAAAGARGDEPSPAVQFEVLLPISLVKGAAEHVAKVVERITRTQHSQGLGLPVTKERVAMAVKEALASVAAGNATDVRVSSGVAEAATTTDGTITAASSGDEPAGASSSTASGSSSSTAASTASSSANTISIKYSRVPLDAARTDPFSGLFIGSFGPHGPELLRLQRAVLDGEETVVATKLTGDANVPAGVTSFRAKIGRKHKLPTRDVYPDDLGIVARYKGEGRVAQKGYAAPRWVEGELLVFAGSSPLTGGSELGFVWAVPGERRFLILLQKLDLAACAERP